MRRRARRPAHIDGHDVPPELLDAAAPVWHDAARYVEYMTGRGWDDHLPPSERFGVPTHPANRRNAAAAAWGVENGITNDGPWFADWHRLREMGLIE